MLNSNQYQWDTGMGANREPVFFLVLALIFTDTMLYGTIVPLIPVYTNYFNFTAVSMGMVFAAYAVGLLFCSIPLGIAAEKYGYKNVFTAGMVVLIISFIFYDYVNSPWMLFFARLIQGMAAAATWTAGLAAVALLYPEHVGEKIGIVMAAMGMGTILGPPVGGFLYRFFGYQKMFVVLAFICFLLLLLVLKTNFHGLIPKSKSREPVNFRRIAQNPSLLWLCVVVTVCCSSLGMLEIILPNQMDGNFGLDSFQIGLLFGAMGLIHAVGDTLVGYWSDRYGFTVFVFWGLLGAAACLPFLALAPSVAFLIIAMALVGVTVGAAMVPSQPLMHRIILSDAGSQGNGDAGFAYGLFNTCYSMGLILGPLLGGALYKYFGFFISLLCYALLFLLSAMAFYKKVIKSNKNKRVKNSTGNYRVIS